MSDANAPLYIVSFSLKDDTPENRERVRSHLARLGFTTSVTAGPVVSELPETMVIGRPTLPGISRDPLPDDADKLHSLIFGEFSKTDTQLKSLFVGQVDERNMYPTVLWPS